MLYSNVNAYTPLKASRIFDADVILASVDNILNTPPRTRLFHPAGYDPERWLFSMETNALGMVILNDTHSAMAEDPRLTMLYNKSNVSTDFDNHSITLDLQISIAGLGGKIFRRRGTITQPVPT